MSFAVGILLATAAAAQTPEPPPVAGATDQTAELERLRGQILAGQQELLRLRRALAEETSRAAALDACRAKNARLVEIGNDLVSAYGKRYRQSRHDPFQLGRRRFESELQDRAEAIYSARADVPEKIVKPSSNDTTSPSGSRK